MCEPPIKPRHGVEFKLVIDELLNRPDFNYPLSSTEKQILYMDQQKIYRISPAVLGTMYEACNKSLYNQMGKLTYVP